MNRDSGGITSVPAPAGGVAQFTVLPTTIAKVELFVNEHTTNRQFDAGASTFVR
jgi:hypothetical protein